MWLSGIGFVSFQLVNLIRHPTSYSAAIFLALTSAALLLIAVHAQYQLNKIMGN